MLVPNLLPKVVPHGPRLLPGLIVRTRGRLVAGEPTPRPRAAPVVPPCSPTRRSSPWPSSPSGPASAARGTSGASPPLTCAPTSRSLLPEPAQPAHPSPGARVARFAAGLGRGTLRAFGRLPRPGHHPRPGDRAGEGFPQGALLRAGHLRQERLQDRVGLRLQGSPGGRSRRGGHRLRSGPGVLRREAHRGSPRGSDRHEAYLADKGFTGVEWERRWLEEYGSLVAATPKNDSRRAGRRPIAGGRPASARSSRG